MWSEPKLTIDIIVDSVVVHEERYAHDREWPCALLDLDLAQRTILRVADVDDVIRWIHCDPQLIKHKVELWEVIVALGDDSLTLNLIVRSADLTVHLFDVSFEDYLW